MVLTRPVGRCKIREPKRRDRVDGLYGNDKSGDFAAGFGCHRRLVSSLQRGESAVFFM